MLTVAVQCPKDGHIKLHFNPLLVLDNGVMRAWNVLLQISEINYGAPFFCLPRYLQKNLNICFCGVRGSDWGTDNHFSRNFDEVILFSLNEVLMPLLIGFGKQTTKGNCGKTSNTSTRTLKKMNKRNLLV